MAKRFTNHARTIAYNFLVERDGEKCKLPDCPKAPPQYRLEIDHIDGDDGNNAPANLRLLCVTHNRRLAAIATNEKRKARKNAFPDQDTTASAPSSSDAVTLHQLTREHRYQAPSDPNLSPDEIGAASGSGKPSGGQGGAPAGASRRNAAGPGSGEIGNPPRDATTARRSEVDYTRAPAQMQANNLYEPSFRSWVNIYLNSRGQAEWSDLQYGGAEAVGCSPQTAHDYLRKLTSGPGPLERFRVGNSWGVRRKGQP